MTMILFVTIIISMCACYVNSRAFFSLFKKEKKEKEKKNKILLFVDKL